jgi:carbohydrate-selective porin OprB
VGAWYVNDRTTLVGLASDANADRFDFGDIGEGDLFTAAEIHFKIAPRTAKAGYSKLTLWHTDGTKDGSAINAMTGESGWGYFVKHEQELTDDGRVVGILRYGKGFEDSAFYEQQAGAHLLFYEPGFLARLKNDVVGAAFNWAKASATGARDEYNAEVFYRFPIFPAVDTTVSYQSVINPALTRDVDHASVFSLRLRTVF